MDFLLKIPASYVIVAPGVFCPLFWVKSFLTKRFRTAPRKLASFNLLSSPLSTWGGMRDGCGRGRYKSIARSRNFHRNQKVRNKKTNSEKKTLGRRMVFGFVCLFLLLMFFLKMGFFNSKQHQKNTHITHHTPSIFRFLPIHPSIHPSIHPIHSKAPNDCQTLEGFVHSLCWIEVMPRSKTNRTTFSTQTDGQKLKLQIFRHIVLRFHQLL